MILCFARQRVYVVGLDLLGKEIFSTKKCVHNYFYNYACWRISRIVRLKKKKSYFHSGQEKLPSNILKITHIYLCFLQKKKKIERIRPSNLRVPCLAATDPAASWPNQAKGNQIQLPPRLVGGNYIWPYSTASCLPKCFFIF